MIAAKAIRSHWFGRTRRPVEAIESSMGEFRLARDHERKGGVRPAGCTTLRTFPLTEAIGKSAARPHEPRREPCSTNMTGRRQRPCGRKTPAFSVRTPLEVSLPAEN